jgi:hypothetical protein
MRKKEEFGKTDRCVWFVPADPYKCKDLTKMMIAVSSSLDLPPFSSSS